MAHDLLHCLRNAFYTTGDPPLLPLTRLPSCSLSSNTLKLCCSSPRVSPTSPQGSQTKLSSPSSCSYTSLNTSYLRHCSLSFLTFFVVFLIIYLVSVMGNLGMIILISLDSHLHNPMYFFWHLSFCDICYSSSIAPRMLSDLVSESRTISFSGCTAQFYFCASFVAAECYILAVMAYDHFVAICNPLLYSTAMSESLCIQLLLGLYIAGTTSAIIHTTATFSLHFCSSNRINHFFCDVPPLLAIACSDTHLNEILLFAFAGFVEMSSLSIVIVSYIFILAAVLRMHSGRLKAFSTCGSHFTGVTLFYGPGIFMYLRPTSVYALDQDKWASVFYTVVNPMLNPLIYSLRNKDVKETFRKLINKKLNFDVN